MKTIIRKILDKYGSSLGQIPYNETYTVDKGIREMFLKTKLNSKKK